MICPCFLRQTCKQFRHHRLEAAGKEHVQHRPPGRHSCFRSRASFRRGREGTSLAAHRSIPLRRGRTSCPRVRRRAPRSTRVHAHPVPAALPPTTTRIRSSDRRLQRRRPETGCAMVRDCMHARHRAERRAHRRNSRLLARRFRLSPCPPRLARRCRERTLERRSIGRRSVREKDDLDGEREQWLHALEDLFRGDARSVGTLFAKSPRNCRPLPRSWSVSPATSARVALDPEHEVVRLHPRVRLDADRQPLAFSEDGSVDRGRVALVRRRHIQGCAVAVRESLGRRVCATGTSGRSPFHAPPASFSIPARQRERIEQQQTRAVVDRVRRDQRPHHCRSFHSGCRASQCQTPVRTSCTARCYATGRG